MPETTPLIKAALNLRVGVGFDVYQGSECDLCYFLVPKATVGALQRLETSGYSYHSA